MSDAKPNSCVDPNNQTDLCKDDRAHVKDDLNQDDLCLILRDIAVLQLQDSSWDRLFDNECPVAPTPAACSDPVNGTPACANGELQASTISAGKRDATCQEASLSSTDDAAERLPLVMVSSCTPSSIGQKLSIS